MSVFDEFDIKDAQDAVKEFVPDGHQPNRDFYRGDHWQSGNAWIGPRPTGGDATTVLAQIQAGFVSRNAIKEVTDRHVNGVLGRRPSWAPTLVRPLQEGEEPTPQEAELMAEAEGLLEEWLRRQLRAGSDKDEATDPVRSCLTNALLDSRSTLRLFVPPAEVENGTVARAEPAESIRRIHLHCVSVENAGVLVDRASQQRCGVYVYTEDEKDAAELTYLDDEGNTVIKVMAEAGSQETVLPLGGRLTMHELRRPLIIGEPVRSQQKLLNMAMTMMGRNVVLGGFLERVLLNAQLPGRFVTEDGQRRFVPDAIKAGAGTLNAYVGIEITNPDGSKSLSQPDIRWRDPVAIDTFRDTVDLAYLAILHECHQLHYAIAGDAVASGVSRVQAMADFAIDLLMTKTALDRAWAWMLETVLAMTAVFSGQPDRYAELRIAADARVDAGPMTPEERKAIIEIVNSKLASRETGMAWLGVDDPKAEQDRIEAESEREQAGLAAALLNAQTNFDQGGQQA